MQQLPRDEDIRLRYNKLMAAEWRRESHSSVMLGTAMFVTVFCLGILVGAWLF